MSDTVEPRLEPRERGVDRRRTAVACALILLAAAAVTAVTFLTEPTAARESATRETAMLVDAVPAERGTFRPVIVGMGTVEPERDVVLSPQVSGQIVERAPEFVPGGFVLEGEVLLRIDPEDYRNALQQRRGELRQALTDLEIEEGRQYVARQDYELLDRELPEERKALVLREPQLAAAQQRVEAARAAVAQAELELRRTRVEAPFSAQVLRRDVNVGSRVSPGDALGRLVGLDRYWVAVDVPLSRLRWLSFPGGSGEQGSRVRVRNRTAWAEGAFREGRVDRLVGSLGERTRMARVLVTVPDPLARGGDAGPDTPILMVGEYLEARIEGEPLEDVIRLDRHHVRNDDTVWVMEDERLRIHEVEVALRDERYAYVAAGLDAGDLVVTTNLATVVEGARLRVESAD